MVDILKMGASNLSDLQQALSTTGHNIANANTEGYSRQTVNFETRGYQGFGFGFVGQGSKIQSIERGYDDFLTTQVQDFSSSQSRYDTFVNYSARVDNILANSDNSLNTSLQKFFSAVQDVAANPSTLPERQVLIGEASNLVDRQQNFTSLLQDLNTEINSGLSNIVEEVNGLASSISMLNTEIVSAISSANGNLPNDLLDQRDMLIKQLSQKISVTTLDQDNGALNVFIGKGQALVIGSQPTLLQTQINPFDSSRIEIGIAGQSNVDDTSQFVSGGELQGLIDFRNRVLVPAQMQLGLVTLGLSETVNAQHRTGMDLNGNMGGDFFASSSIEVSGHTKNAGSAQPQATLDDVSSVRASDYSLIYDGSQWQMTRVNDNTSVSGTGSLTLDGITVDLSSGTPSAGDRFILNPAKTAGTTFGLAVTDPRNIAAASPVITETSTTNLGTGKLVNLSVDPETSFALSESISLTYNATIPGFDVLGGPGGTIAYDPNTESGGKFFNFLGNGISFEIADFPEDGDSFTINQNAGGVGDNSNILKMGELQYKSLLNGGEDTYQEFYGSMVAQVGVTNRQAEANLSVETTLLEQAEQYRDSVSGVNLDEEAANLIRYQQAYQAAAKIIQIADEIFETLINSIR